MVSSTKFAKFLDNVIMVAFGFFSGFSGGICLNFLEIISGTLLICALVFFLSSFTFSSSEKINCHNSGFLFFSIFCRNVSRQRVLVVNKFLFRIGSNLILSDSSVLKFPSLGKSIVAFSIIERKARSWSGGVASLIYLERFLKNHE